MRKSWEFALAETGICIKTAIFAPHARSLRMAKVTYAELVKRLKKHGFKDETEAGITMKLKRGTFSATFFLACIAAMELEGVALDEI
jgi:hypothetical protein